VAEQLLDRAQVGAALEKMRRERVAETMRMRRQAAQRARVQPLARHRKEERVVRAARQLGACIAEIPRDPVRRLLAERDHAILAALAVPNVHVLLLEVDVPEIEADRFGASQSCGIDELDERSVPERQRPLTLEQRELLLHRVPLRRVRQAATAPRPEPSRRHAGRPERMPQEGPHRRELAADRGGCETSASPAPGAEHADVLDERAHVHVVECCPFRLEPAAELGHVDAVRAACPLGERR
jgi:hypothetical protein